MTKGLVRVVAPHFVAGLELDRGVVVNAAPILLHLLGMPSAEAHRRVLRRGWSWTTLDPGTP